MTYSVLRQLHKQGKHLGDCTVDYWQRFPERFARFDPVPYVVVGRLVFELLSDFNTVSEKCGDVDALCDQRIQNILQQVDGRNTDEFKISWVRYT